MLCRSTKWFALFHLSYPYPPAPSSCEAFPIIYIQCCLLKRSYPIVGARTGLHYRTLLSLGGSCLLCSQRLPSPAGRAKLRNKHGESRKVGDFEAVSWRQNSRLVPFPVREENLQSVELAGVSCHCHCLLKKTGQPGS